MGVCLLVQDNSQQSSWGTWLMLFAWLMDLRRSRSYLTQFLDAPTSVGFLDSKSTAVVNQPLLALRMHSTKSVVTSTLRMAQLYGSTFVKNQMCTSMENLSVLVLQTRLENMLSLETSLEILQRQMRLNSLDNVRGERQIMEESSKLLISTRRK